MKNVFKVQALAAIATTHITAVASSLTSLPEQQIQYIQRYVSVINSSDIRALQAIKHRTYLSCINDENSDYYQHIFNQSLQRTIPAEYKVIFEVLTDEDINHELVGAEKRGLPYPVAPTHQVQIDYNKTEYSSVGIVRKLVLDNGQYYQVPRCTNPNLLGRFRTLELKKKAEQKSRNNYLKK